MPKNLYERIAEMADYKKYTSALLMILFDRETLATHSLQGRRTTFSGDDCPKPQLPPEILRSIIGRSASLNVKLSQSKPLCLCFSLFLSNGTDQTIFLLPTDHVAVKFNVDQSQIRTAIRTKLNNEDKLLKKRLGLCKVENKAAMEQSFCQDTSLHSENGAQLSPIASAFNC